LAELDHSIYGKNKSELILESVSSSLS